MLRKFNELSYIRKLLASMGVDEIARRMFVTNSFDSMIAIIGIVLGNYIFGISNPHSYLGSALGGSMTMGIFSSFFGVYVTEKAERLRELREIEEQLLIEIRNSLYSEVVRFAPIYVALWSMFGSILFTFISLIPFFIAVKGAISIAEAVGSSVIMLNTMIGFLGAYMGKISGEGGIAGSLKFLALSLSATAILSAISLLTP